MNSNRKTAIIVGVLFLITFITNFIGSEMIESILNDSDYLINLYPNRTQVILSILMELIDVVAALGIAVLLFPILKKHNRNIALGYLSFRIIESVFLIISGISPLPLLELSRKYIEAGIPFDSYVQTLSDFIVTGRYWAFEIVKIFYFLTALMFFYSSYHSKLIPRFLSVWGLIGAPVALVASLLMIIGIDTGMILYLPGGLTEPFLGAWLIIKGFNLSAIKTPIGEPTLQ